MTAARKLANEGTHGLPTGKVILCQGESFSVALSADAAARAGLDRSELVARRAASCLLEPQPGDRVLVALTPEPFILAVLERDEREPARVLFRGDARVEAAGGQLHLGASEGIRLTTERAISTLSEAINLRANAGELVAKTVAITAQAAQGHFNKLGIVAETYNRVAESISERAKRVYRFVEEFDQLRTRHFDYRAEHAAQIKGENTAVIARQVAKVDGEQVHIG